MALLVGRAGAAHAVARVAGHLVPDGIGGQRGQVGERAIGGLPGPCGHRQQLRPFPLVGKQAPRPLEGEGQPTKAHVVAAALHQHRRKLPRHDGRHQRNILGDELLLQGDRVRRDHHPPRPVGTARGRRLFGIPIGLRDGLQLGLISRRRKHGWHEVGEALAHAGARLDDRVLPRGDRLGDEVCHLDLLRPRLPSGQPGGEPPAGRQNILGGRHLIECSGCSLVLPSVSPLAGRRVVGLCEPKGQPLLAVCRSWRVGLRATGTVIGRAG